MSEQTSQEPTMEEILASIRRIISEDDAPADGAAAAEAEPEPEQAAAPAFTPEPEPEAEDDGALELTERIETVGDLDVYTPTVSEEPEAPLAAYEPPPAYDPPPAPSVEVGEGLVGAVAATAAASAFGQLSAAIQMPADGRTLEDVVRELLRPLLKQWLDDNLPAIVQATVDKEVERIARGRVR
jgi:cell pole-organizing protein PopZ